MMKRIAAPAGENASGSSGTTVSFIVSIIDDQHLLVIPDGRPALVMTVDVPELIGIARSKATRSITEGECDTYHVDPCSNVPSPTSRDEHVRIDATFSICPHLLSLPGPHIR
jgi:hypothetical protein